MQRALKIVSDELPFPLLPSSINSTWFLANKTKLFSLREHIIATHEEIWDYSIESLIIQKSILTWSDFTLLCSQFQLQDPELVSLFLRHIGAIHHYRDVPEGKNSFSELVFLQPDSYVDYLHSYQHLLILISIFQYYTKLLQCFATSETILNNNSSLRAISKNDILESWKFLLPEYHEPFLQLYEHCGQIFPITTEKTLFISTTALPYPPNDFRFDKQPKWEQLENPNIITRCYSFEKMSDKNFCEILSFLHSFACSYDHPKQKVYVRDIYQYCIELELQEMKKNQNFSADSFPMDLPPVTRSIGCCRINYDFARNCVTLFVSEIDESHQFFGIISESLEDLFSSRPVFLRSEEPVHAMCVCEDCRLKESRLDSSLWTPLSWIEAVARQGNAFLYCGDHAIRIDLLAPDITLATVTKTIIDYDSIQIIKELGNGSFSTVFYGIKGKKEMAVKKLDTKAPKAEIFLEFRKEVSLMAGLRHPNCVSLIGVCKQPFCVLTGFCPFGDLNTYLVSRKERNFPLPIPFIIDVLLDVAKGMRFLHTTTPPVLHRDLKSPNILLCRISPDEDQGDKSFPTPDYLIAAHVPSPETAKISDFGLSKRLYYFGIAERERVVDNPLWLAPELLSKQPYSLASDVYAFGIVCNEMFSMELPFADIEYSFTVELEQHIINGGRPKQSLDTPYVMKKLIEECWHENPLQRPTFTKIVATLEEIHLEFPTLRKASTWSEEKLTTFKESATSTKKKRTTRLQERRKYSKEVMDGLLSDSDLELLLLSHQKHVPSTIDSS